MVYIIFNTNNNKGNSGPGIAIAYFSCNGYTVSILRSKVHNRSSINLCSKYKDYQVKF